MVNSLSATHRLEAAALLGAIGLVLCVSGCAGGGKSEAVQGRSVQRSQREVAQRATAKPSSRSAQPAARRQRSQGSARSQSSTHNRSGQVAKKAAAGGKRAAASSRLPDRVQEPIRLAQGQVNRGRLRGGFEQSDTRLHRANQSAPDGKPMSGG